MKKFLVSLLAVLVLVSGISLTAFAADTDTDTDVQFSVKGTEGRPGDEVEVKVYLDKTPGIWCAKFEVHFNQSYFQLISVENGEVFSDAEFNQSKLTEPGSYTYYAEGKQYDQNNTSTGLILTLKLQILKSAVNGDQEVSLVFPDNGFGWFFNANNLDQDYSVSQTNTAYITVSGSDATAGPADVTTAVGGKPSSGSSSSSSGATNYVTDAEGAPVTDSKGSYETYKVPAGEPVIGYETDEEGAFVTDEEGNYETYVISENAVTDPDEETTGADADSTASDNTETTPKNDNVKKVVIIGCIAAIIVAAIILIVVLTSRKNDDTDNNNMNDGGNSVSDGGANTAVPEAEAEQPKLAEEPVDPSAEPAESAENEPNNGETSAEQESFADDADNGDSSKSE